MANENTSISSWSGKARPSKRQELRRHGEPYSAQPPSAAKLTPRDAKSPHPDSDTGLVAPQTPNIVVTPKAGQSSEMSCVGSTSSDGGSSLKSAEGNIQRRPSLASGVGEQAQPPEMVSSDVGSTASYIKTIDSLLPAIKAARPGEVAHVLGQCAFKPREAAFTKMIKECGKDVAKAMELWEAMNTLPGLKANTISYSVLINVCGNAGAWQQAESLFKQQTEAANTDPACQPNTFTYSNLMMALLKAQKVDQALHWYDHMRASEISADPQLYSNVILASLDAGMSLGNILRLVDDMHSQGMFAGSNTYAATLTRVASERGWGQALELFLCAVMAGAAATTSLCLTLLTIFGQAGATLPAAQLVHEFMAQDYSLADKGRMAHAALELYAQAGRYQRSVQLWETFWKPSDLPEKAAAAKLVLETIQKVGRPCVDGALEKDLQAAMQVQPARKRPPLPAKPLVSPARDAPEAHS